MLTLVTGGAASGKSEYAERLACLSAGTPRVYIATMRPWDAECGARIAKHRDARAGRGFLTLECYERLIQAEIPGGASVLLECLSNLTANEVFGGAGADAAEEILRGIDRVCATARDTVIVTNELFSDGTLYEEGTMRYLGVLGEINRVLATRADRVVETVCGIPVFWKGEAI